MTNSSQITLTNAAVKRVKALMSRADQNVIGLRVGVKPTGCSGYSYVVEYASDERPFEDVIEQDGVKIMVDPAAMMFLVGSEMDYVEEKLEARFVFANPNEKSRCGCGESFQV